MHLEQARFEAPHCTLSIASPAPRVLSLVLTGRDLGELGDAPFRELARRMSGDARYELFIDARDAISATMEVSGSWAVWLGANKHRLEHVSMLTGSRFIKLTAGIVRGFAELGEAMRLYTDARAFDEALAGAACKK